MTQAIIHHGFLDPTRFDELQHAFPKPPSSGFRSHRDLSHLDEKFSRLPACWQELCAWICSREFWEEQCSRFPSLAASDYALDRFDPSEGEGVNGTRAPSRDVQYSRFDIGWGGIGYGIVNGGRGNHIDNRLRVISGLLYFSDQSAMKGGEFELTTKDGDTLERIPVRENTAILTLQNQDGWHRVNPVTEIAGWRRAVYFALSDTRNIFGR